MSAEVAASVFPQLEALLPHVQKPIQYVGGELNSTVKPWETTDVRWALMYPDAYEVGLPNQGVMILYEVLNEREGVLAERTYSVWPDLEELMREHRVPQFTVDSHRPVKAFDVFGLSFSTELGYTNMLTALDLAGIPLESKDRTLDDPIVLAGGHAAFNPEPIADFVDAVIIGDGEQAVLDMTDIIRAWKAEGSRAAARRSCSASRRRAASTSRRSTTSSTCRTAVSPAWSRTSRVSRGGCRSTRSWTWTSGLTRSSRSSRSRRRSTSACRSRSSAAARAAAASARRA